MSNKSTIASLITSYLVTALIISTGCASRGGILGVDSCADIPAGAIPEPAGTKVCDWQTDQVAGAIADQTVFYNCDFVGQTAKISPDALHRIASTASNGLAANQPSIIESSGDETLDTARVTAVTLQLASYGITQPAVEVAIPAALGMQGVQAERIANGMGSFRNGGSRNGGGFQSGGFGSGRAFGNTFSGATY